MALTYGFYNSIEGDRVYDAIQFGRIFDGIIKDGVYATYEKGMMVIASSSPAEVIIQPGRAWFNHTWSYNDANVIFEAPAPEVLLERIDALVLEVNEELSARENSYKWVTGTPSSRPERPTLTNTSTIHQYPLCYVHRYPETTMIYTRDITNMIGTSECPFATGVLEGIDLDAWINQWDDEFHNWENTKKTQFEAWMLSQETAFTTWYNAFKDQMAADVAEVEDFVDYLESVLDASTAVHLQEEIDELRDEISSGSHITVTTINPELYGRNVTITEAGGTVFTEKFDNTGVAEFKSVPYVGNLTISSTYGTQTAERVVNTPYYARYEFAIAFWAATVNIVGDPEMSGSSVTVKDSNETVVGTVVLNSEGTGVYTAIKPDTYKFTLTYGGETMEVTLSVTQETTYTVDLHAISFKLEDWLEAGGVTGSYSSLDDVLADEVALRRLFTVHASVDYLASIDKENEDVEKIIGTDLAAKWINLSDYALDTLYANEIIAGYMDTADKYGYGEYCLLPQVPKMTGNTSPYGEASCSSTAGADYAAWKAFDGKDVAQSNENYDRWVSVQSNTQILSSEEYIQYEFSSNVIVKAVAFQARVSGRRVLDTPYDCAIKLQGSNDGTTFIDIDTINSLASNSDVVTTYKVNNSTAYKIYRLAFSTGNIKSDMNLWYCNLNLLQFYAYAPKGNVPVMTSNSAPYGEASASTVLSGSAAYKAFDNDPSTVWNASSASYPQHIQYKSANPICVKRFHMKIRSDNVRVQTYKIQGSNDGFVNDTHDLTETLTATYNADGEWVDIDNSSYYLYYRVSCLTGTYTAMLEEVQFYGRELSVSVPVMTANTTPYGVASASGETEFPAWRGFRGQNDTQSDRAIWSTTKTGNDWIDYKFGKDTVLKAFKFVDAYSASGVTFSIALIGRRNNEDTIIQSYSDIHLGNALLHYFSLPNNEEVFDEYRIKINSATSNAVGMGNINFFGLDYSEKEFEEGTTKKWLYDHGVELEPITVGTQCVKENAQIVCNGLNSITSDVTMAHSTAKVDLSPFSMMRGIIGTKNKLSNDRFGIAYVLSGDTIIFNTDYWTANEQYASIPNPNTTIHLEVSSINESKYIGFGCGSDSNRQFSVAEWWLE